MPSVARAPAYSTLAYISFGALWIFFSDWLLGVIIHNQGQILQLSMAKGWLFVGLTGAALYLVQRKHEQRASTTQAQLLEAETKKEAADARFREYIEHAPMGVVVFDLDGRAIEANPAARQLLGAEALTGEGSLLDLALDGERQDRARDLARLASEGRWTGEFRARGVEGPLWLSVQAVRLCRGSFIAFLRDVSAGKLIEEQLRQAQKMEAIGRLAGGVAHDFNNLLTVIMSNASMLELPDLAAGETAELASQIGEATSRAAVLTRQLLLFSRKQPMKETRLDLNEVVSNLSKMLGRIVGEDISLHTHLEAGLPPILGDSGMIEQVIMNMAVNSRDAMPGGGHLEIATHCDEAPTLPPGATPGACVVLEISDSGVGIPAEALPHIFEPFFTTKEVGKGTGLGLATTHGIVEKHRGWITVDSKPGHGTTFRIFLPATSTPRDEAPLPEALRLQRGTEAILVVEDEVAVRATISQVLRRCGYRVLEARSGDEALAIWQEKKAQIRLLLADGVMPGSLSGFELGARLLQERPRLPVIYISGYAPSMPPGVSFEEGRNFLPKPFNPAQLSEILRRRLDETPAP